MVSAKRVICIALMAGATASADTLTIDGVAAVVTVAPMLQVGRSTMLVVGPSTVITAAARSAAGGQSAGAIVQSKPGTSTDVLVHGRPNELQIAGKGGGSKLIRVRRLAEQGHKVTVIGEKLFWRLAVPRRVKETTRRSAKR